MFPKHSFRFPLYHRKKAFKYTTQPKQKNSYAVHEFAKINF